MKYVLLNQKYGILDSLEAVKVNNRLECELENVGGFKEPLTVKLMRNDSVWYFKVDGGRFSFPREALLGNVAICVVTGDGIVPCLGLVCIVGDDGMVNVIPDVKDVLTRLVDTEREMSDTLQAYRQLEEKYKSLEDRLLKLFSESYY